MLSNMWVQLGHAKFEEHILGGRGEGRGQRETERVDVIGQGRTTAADIFSKGWCMITLNSRAVVRRGKSEAKEFGAWSLMGMREGLT